ncbi:hypothetical protein TMEC50S_00695 [Thauera mechernichensis]
MQVARQCAQVVLPVGFVLRVELHDPGVLVQFVEGILQRVLQGVSRLPQPRQLAPFGADRQELEERRHRLAVLEQHAFRAGQVLDPGQQVREGRRDVVERLGVCFGGRSAVDGAARLRNAVPGQRRDMAPPCVVRRGGRKRVCPDWPRFLPVQTDAHRTSPRSSSGSTFARKRTGMASGFMNADPIQSMNRKCPAAAACALSPSRFAAYPY